MGTAVSRTLDLSTNEYLVRFCGAGPSISINDPFWNRFLAFNITPPTTRDEQLAFECRLEDHNQALLKHNPTTGNFATLIDIFVIRSRELLTATTIAEGDNNAATLFSWQLFNAMFIIRCYFKFLIDTMISGGGSESQLLAQQHIDAQHRITELIDALVGIVAGDVPVNRVTYAVHLEAVTTLLALLLLGDGGGGGGVAHRLNVSDHSVIYRTIMTTTVGGGSNGGVAPRLVRALLENSVRQLEAPPPLGGDSSGGHSVVLDLAADLWSMITFAKKPVHDQLQAVNVVASSASTTSAVGGGGNINSDFPNAPLAMQSLLLLFVLTHHWTTKSNPYRTFLFNCANSSGAAGKDDQTTTKIDYDALYSMLCERGSSQTTTLLLYLVIHHNQSFRVYVTRERANDLERLIVPILKTLYNAPRTNNNSHHIYMSLIILLILSEDDTFNRAVHEIKLRNCVWYTERVLNDVSLGGLLILIVIRTIQYNMLRMRDKYLHTNCLAALANMSSQFRDLHPYVSQRLISLFETLAKRHQRLTAKLSSNHDNHVSNNNNSTTTTTSEVVLMVDGIGNNTNNNNLQDDLDVLEEVLRMILEILNSAFSHQLINNPNLVYTLLYSKDVFEPFKRLVAFQDVIRNVDIVVGYFSDLLSLSHDRSENGQSHRNNQQVDANQVLHVIQEGAKHWPKDKLTKFPDLKFKYVEEEQPEEFFIPYVWALVNQQSQVLHWTDVDTSSSILSTI